MAGFLKKKTNEAEADVLPAEALSYRSPLAEQGPLAEGAKESLAAENKESPHQGAGSAQGGQAASHVAPLAERVSHPQTKSEKLAGIEKVMSENLEDIFFGLDRQQQQIIKAEGEKTATQIEQLLEQGKAVAKKVLQLIRAWLHKIPGVNSFFLEQESKIKTDKILAMTRRE